MDKLSDILSQYEINEPEEIIAIKRYILKNYKIHPEITIKGESLIISLKSASLANNLRMRILDLQAAANTDKKIIFRIS